ncbi:MAG: hypothetical protein EP343_26740 [Deltaproteobacteria bacterium]|nr:MAG: hypothetical protein EP343_26740 [Deltaproteobacteria bacterium]
MEQDSKAMDANTETPAGIVRWEQTLDSDASEARDMLNDMLSLIPATFRMPEAVDATEHNPRDVLYEIRDQLAKAIVKLIDHDMNKLMQVLYRIDVPEILVNDAFSLPFQQIPVRLAELILARQLQKVFTQREHARQTESSLLNKAD